MLGRDDILNLTDPRCRLIFSERLSGIRTRCSIRLGLVKHGYSVLLGRKRVHFIPMEHIEADFRADDYASLDQRFESAADAVISALEGKK